MERIKDNLERIRINLDYVITQVSLPYPNLIKIQTNHSRILDEILNSVGPTFVHHDNFVYSIERTITEIRGGRIYRLLIHPQEQNEKRAIDATHDFVMHLSRAVHNYTHTHRNP